MHYSTAISRDATTLITVFFDDFLSVTPVQIGADARTRAFHFRAKPPANNPPGVWLYVESPFETYLSLDTALPDSSMTAWAAASRATGVRLGEQET